jgi:hypothetical protein
MREKVGRFVEFCIEQHSGCRPYLVERLMPAVYRRVELPEADDESVLIEASNDRCISSGRRVCLVFGPDRCLYLEPDGSWEWSGDAPSGGAVVEK